MSRVTTRARSTNTSSVAGSRSMSGSQRGIAFQTKHIQRKVRVGKPGDKYEKEADSVADKVMRMSNPVRSGASVSPNGRIQFKSLSDNISPLILKKEDDEKEKESKKPDILKKGLQKQEDLPAEASAKAGEKEEPTQAKLLQRQEEDLSAGASAKVGKEEPAQAKLLQRQEEDLPAGASAKVGKEEPAQAKLLQRQEEEKEEPAQAKLLQRQEEEKEEPAQAKLLQRQEEEKEEPALAKRFQAEEANDAIAAKSIDSKLTASKGGGDPLPQATASFMGDSIGADFSQVRIHTGGNAQQMSKNLNAQAFTHGKDVYFNQGKYQPESNDGQKLLAHELAHTIQQGAAIRKKVSVSSTPGPVVQRFSLSGIIDDILEYVPGYSLIKVLIGKNPVTGEPVPRTAVNILKGILGLIPGIGTFLFNQLSKTGAIEKAGAWLSMEVEKLGITWSTIKDLIATAWDKMSIWKGISGNLAVVKEVFSPPWQRILTFIGNIGTKIKEFIIEGALMLAGAAGKQVLGVFKKNRAAFMKIVNDPIGLIKNFFTAVKMGFFQFKNNFLKHLKNAIFEWLFGKISEAGIQLPEKFDLKGIFSLIMQILGLTYDHIRAKIVKRLGPKGETIVSTIEKGVAFVKDLITRGPIVLWEKAKESLGNLKDMLTAKVGVWVSQTIVGKAIAKLAMMLNPAGAIIQAAMAIYNTVMFFIERWEQIKETINAIFQSVANVALGKLKPAAAFIEKTMAKGLTLIISFLARFVGLGGISKKIQNIIQTIRKPFDKVVDKVVGMIVKIGKKVMKFGKKMLKKGKKMLKKGKETIKKVLNWWKRKKDFSTNDGQKHTLTITRTGGESKANGS